MSGMLTCGIKPCYIMESPVLMAHLDCHVTLGNFSHIETHCRDHVFIELSTLK